VCYCYQLPAGQLLLVDSNMHYSEHFVVPVPRPLLFEAQRAMCCHACVPNETQEWWRSTVQDPLLRWQYCKLLVD
jgi:hypothetical protein